MIKALNSIAWQKNYNSGGDVMRETARDARTATVRIHHDASRPSMLELPVVRRRALSPDPALRPRCGPVPSASGGSPAKISATPADGRPCRCPAKPAAGAGRTLCRAGKVCEVARAGGVRDTRTVRAAAQQPHLCGPGHHVGRPPVAIHLSRKAEHKLFEKVASDRRQVTHVARLHDMAELEAMKPFLREAYE